MARIFNIELRFSSPGAKDLRRAIEGIAKAQRDLASAQQKLNKESNASIAQNKRLVMSEEKHRMAMLKQSTQIAKLREQIRLLVEKNKQLANSQDKSTSAVNRMRLATRGLTRTVGVIRNQILLFTFAFGAMIAGFKNAIKTSIEFEAVKVRLNSMFGSVEAGEKAFRRFNQVAATTPFTLTDVVEAGASLKAFGTNAEAMIKPTADLAAFMGVSATEAAQALGRAFAGGAGAADILRERGILQLIRDTQGIQDLSKLTLPEFRKALEKTLLDPAAGIAGATDKLAKSMSGMLSNMADAFTRMSAAFGDLINFRNIVKGLTDGFSSLADFFKRQMETPFETTIRQLQEMGRDTTKLELSQAKLNKKRMEETEIIRDLDSANSRIEETEKARGDQLEKIAKLQESLNTLLNMEELDRLQLGQTYVENKKVLEELIKKEQEKLPALDDSIEKAKEQLQTAIEYQTAVEKIAALEVLLAKIRMEAAEDFSASFINNPQALIDAYSGYVELTQAQQKLILEGETMLLQTREELFSQHFQKLLSLAQQNLNQRKNAELQALRDTDAYRNASSEKRETMEKDALKKFREQQKIIFRIQQAVEIGQVITSTIKTIAKIQLMRAELESLALLLAQTNPIGSARAAAAAKGLGVISGLTKATSAAQIGLIAAQQPPAFARGGSFITNGQQMIMVGDNAGGRERVDITPISSPDFGDAGGGNGITVNIMGNVIGTQEFVRDNLLPEIENSIRRNLA